MAIRVNRFTALVLMALLFPLVLVIGLVRLVMGRRKPVYASTIEGDPLAYTGDRPLLIAVWAEWASVWTAATAQAVEQLRQEFAGQCEFGYVEASGRSVTDAYRAEVVPVLILRHRGAEVGRFANVLRAEEVRPAIAAAVAGAGAAPDSGGMN
jgi:hypothetical protein